MTRAARWPQPSLQCGRTNRAAEQADTHMKNGSLKIVCLFPILLVCLSGCGNNDSMPQSATATSATTAAQNLTSAPGLSKAAITILTGQDGAGADEKGWPKSATVSLLQTDEEKRFLDDVGCFGDGCFTAEKFDAFIRRKYPDIAKVHFRPPEAFDGDEEAIANARLDFRRSLYFAKRIQLADGESLFDLITRCSRSMSPINYASVAREPGYGKPYFDLQYFPVFRKKDTGEDFEVDVLYDRVGDELRARSPFFSTNVLIHRDFLAMHGLECRGNNAPVIKGE